MGHSELLFRALHCPHNCKGYKKGYIIKKVTHIGCVFDATFDRIESFIREVFVHRQHFTAIFFDVEKAYDTTWKFGILKDLHDAGLRDRLPLFIAGFLADRKFQVRVGGSCSKPCNQEMGVPQGSILSVTLFCLKINSIVKALCPGVEFCLYVDDFVICYRSKFIHIIERHLQRLSLIHI